MSRQFPPYPSHTSHIKKGAATTAVGGCLAAILVLALNLALLAGAVFVIVLVLKATGVIA